MRILLNFARWAPLLFLFAACSPAVRAQRTPVQNPALNPMPAVKALLDKADALAKQNRWADALKAYDDSAATARTLMDREGEALALSGSGFVRVNTARPQKALADLQQAQEGFKAVGDHYGEARTILGMGLVSLQRGQPLRARNAFEQALSLNQALGNKTGQARALANLGLVYKDMGQTQKSLASYEQARTLFVQINDKTGEANARMGLANVYHETGQPQKALELYSQLLPIFEDLGDLKNKAIALHNIGAVYLTENENPKALDFMRQALTLYRTIHDRVGEARAMQSIAVVSRKLGQDKLALDYLQDALAIFKSAGARNSTARALANIALIYRDSGQPEKTLDYLQQAIPLFTAARDRNGEAAALDNLAHAEQRLHRPQDALTHSRSAVSLLEQLRAALGGYSEAKTDYLASRLYIYYHCIDLLLQQGNAEEAFDIAQKTKSRALLDLLASGRVDLEGVLTPDERDQEQELRQKADYLNLQMVKEGVENEVGAKERFADLQTELKQTEDQLQTLTDQLYARHPTLARRRPAKTAGLLDIAALLPSDTALLEYLQVSRERLVLFVITTQDGKAIVRPYSISITDSDLQKLCADLRAACSDPKKRWLDVARPAYQLLFPPAEAQITGKTRLVICPDGPLWDVPFAALTDSAGRPLLDRFEIAIASSATAMKAALKARSARTQVSGTLLAFANPDFGTAKRFGDADNLPGQRPIDSPSRPFDSPSRPFDSPSRPIDSPARPLDSPSRAIDFPSRQIELLSDRGDGRIASLPGTQREADALKRDFPDSKVYTGSQAQEEIAKQQMGRYRYLHFATHGFFNDASPMLSSIVLAQPSTGSKEDGFLTAREIFGLDLSGAEMTVLSACNTARGQTRTGEGVIGLTWALFAAGCPTQVVSQWSVDDASTADLMERFYGALKQGTGKGAALRQAALKLFLDGSHSHPYYWAPFILVGDWN